MPSFICFFLCLLYLCPTGTARVWGQTYHDLWQRGEYRRAYQMLEEEVDNPSLAHNLDRSRLLFSLGEVDRAIAIMEGVTDAYPLPSHAVQLARLYRYRGRHADAEIQLARAVGAARSLLEWGINFEQGLALGQALEMGGEDPQAIFDLYENLSERFPGRAPIAVAAGDLAYNRGADDLAGRKYGQALKIDPENQQALAGLAQSYYRSGDPRYKTTLNQLRRLNPNHPRGRLLRAEAALDLGHSQTALTLLDSVLNLNPNHTEALALKAAALFLADDDQTAKAVRRQILAFNPAASAAFRVSGRIASRHYRFAAGKTFQEQALAIDPSDHQARLLLAFDLLRLGQDHQARSHLDGVFAVDPYNVQAYNLLEVSDAIAEFTTRRHEPFVLQLPPLEAAVLGDEIFALLTEAATLFEQKYRLTLQAPVLVQVFSDHDEFMVRSVGLPGSAGHLGICFGQVVTMDSPRARPKGAMNWRQVLWHEFVHVITLQKTNNRLPRWLSEGISVYEETRRNPAWGQKLEPDLAAAVPDTAVGLGHLQDYFAQPQSPAHLLFGYYAAGQFVHFYAETYGEAALPQALEAIGGGKETLSALAAAAGEDPAALDQHFRRFLQGRLGPLANITAGPTSAFSQAVDRGRKAALAADLAAAEAAFLEAHALYPDYTAADAPLRQLAQLYAEHGPKEKYLAALQRILDWDPKAHGEALDLAAGKAALEQWEAAATALGRARQVIPFNLEVAALQADYLDRADNFAAAARLRRQLIDLDPSRQSQHRLALARALVQQRHLKAAKTEVLVLLEGLPHFWEAQELLLEIVETEAAQ